MEDNGLLEEWPSPDTLLEDWSTSRTMPIDYIDQEALMEAVIEANTEKSGESRDELDITFRGYVLSSTYKNNKKQAFVEDTEDEVITFSNMVLEEWPTSRPRSIASTSYTSSSVRCTSSMIDYECVNQSLRALTTSKGHVMNEKNAPNDGHVNILQSAFY